jgi:DNA polymerase III delta prime subunit
LAAIRATADIALSWIKGVYGSPANLALAIGSVVVAIGGVYITREMAVLLREQLNKRLGRPSLVRTTNRRGFLQQFWIGFLRLLRLRSPHGSEFADVVLHPKLHLQVMRLAEATRSAKKRRMPLQHAMFYGPPGTGKTMVAQRFAEYSGLEYAIMSGGDVAPLEEQAVTELHKLFTWVHRSRRGVLLFIDEADAFLASRKHGGNMSETLRNALTTMLYHTGTPSSQFMLVCATNRPGDLDSAVLDRLDEAIEFGLPDIDARKSMVSLYFHKYITKPLGIAPLKETVVKPDAVEVSLKGEILSAEATAEEKHHAGVALRPPKQPAAMPPSPSAKQCNLNATTKAEGPVGEEELVDQAALAEAAQRLHGFSGREIAKLFTSLQTHVLYSHAQLTKATTTNGRKRRKEAHCLPRNMLFEVVDQKVKEHDTSAEFQVSGYNYENAEKKAVPNGAKVANSCIV